MFCHTVSHSVTHEQLPLVFDGEHRSSWTSSGLVFNIVWNSNTSMDFMLEVEVDVMCVDIYALFNPVILCMDQCNYSWGFIDICMVWGSLVAL